MFVTDGMLCKCIKGSYSWLLHVYKTVTVCYSMQSRGYGLSVVLYFAQHDNLAIHFE